MSFSGIIHHSHSFTRLKIYHHIYFIYHTFRHSNPSSMQDVCPMPVSFSGIIHHSYLFIISEKLTPCELYQIRYKVMHVYNFKRGKEIPGVSNKYAFFRLQQTKTQIIILVSYNSLLQRPAN